MKPDILVYRCMRQSGFALSQWGETESWAPSRIFRNNVINTEDVSANREYRETSVIYAHQVSKG